MHTKKHIFLHIGLPKTATSYLQNSFALNHALLEAHDLYYPVEGRIPNHADAGHHLVAVTLQIERLQEFDQKLHPHVSEELWETLRQEIRGCAQHNILISSELFAFDISPRADKMQKLKTELSEFDVTIVLVLRDVVDLMNSLYAQFIKGGMKIELVDAILNLWEMLNWSVLRECWAEVFGQDHVMCLNYDHVKQGDIFVNFCAVALGIHLDKSAIQKIDRNNTSLSKRATALVEELNLSNLSKETRKSLLDHLVGFYNEQPVIHMEKSVYLNKDLEKILRRHCVWPECKSE